MALRYISSKSGKSIRRATGKTHRCLAVSSTVEYNEYSNVRVHLLDFILDENIPLGLQLIRLHLRGHSKRALIGGLPMVDRVGQQLGNYRLVSLLGQGGYAEGLPGTACAAQSASGH